jgi:hypothetical protein
LRSAAKIAVVAPTQRLSFKSLMKIMFLCQMILYDGGIGTSQRQSVCSGTTSQAHQGKRELFVVRLVKCSSVA